MSIAKEPYDIGKLAWDFLSRTRCPPTPEAYAVAYSYVRKESTDLTAAVATAMGRGGRLGSSDAIRIYREHFSEPSVRAVDEIGEGLVDLLSDASESLAEMERAGANVMGLIEEAHGALSGSPKELAARIAKCRANAGAIRTGWAGLAKRLRELASEIETLRKDAARHAETTCTDALTGLPNLRGLIEHLRRDVARALRGGHAVGLFILQVDELGHLNDRHGHEFGDKVLRRIAWMLTKSVREGDVLARLGGARFAVVFPECTPAGAMSAANRIKDAAMAQRIVDPLGRTVECLSISGGIALGGNVVGDADPTDLTTTVFGLALARARAAKRANGGRGDTIVMTGSGAGARPRRRIGDTPRDIPEYVGHSRYALSETA